MVSGKPQFGAVPNRALWDDSLTDRDVRILAVVASFDRLSGAIGKGQGAWASHATMAAIAGAEYSRFSVSINKLLGLEYLVRQPLVTDRRKFTYRVVYTDEDRLEIKLKGLPQRKELPSGKDGNPASDPAETVCQDDNDVGGIVCSDPQLSDCNQDETDAQYISRSEGRDSVETGEINSSEEARFAARGLGKIEFEDNLGGQLARLERSLKAGEAVDCTAWSEWLTHIIENFDDNALRAQATRLADLVVEAMTAEEYAQWGLAHGWVDDDGKWHCPHPREASAA